MNRNVAQRVADLERLVKSGLSLAEAVNKEAPRPRAQKTLMRRLSGVRLFDRELFDAVIGRDLDSSFEECGQAFGVERTHPSSETYRVMDSVAADHLEEWMQENQGRDELITFMGAVYDHMSAREGVQPLELLRFRIPKDPEGGLSEFERLFDEADEAFDLATCHALVQVLRELDNFSAGLRTVPLRLLSTELRARCNELLPYIAARGRFIEEYVKSAKYFERAGLHEKAEAFLAGGEAGIFPIYGTGGRGKTIFLQWLVARYCVPRPRRIPVAKMDFDDINIAKLNKFPWLIFVRLAEQLNRQTEGAPFKEYLERNGEFSQILLPTARLPEGINIDGLEREIEGQTWREPAAVQEFALKLLGRRVVLILDTLEEAVLHFPDSLRATLRVLREVQSPGVAPSQLKLILSGRYNLKDKQREFLGPADPDPVEISPFSESEAYEYLSGIRRVPQQLIPAIISKSLGNPFILSLVADLVDQDDIRDVSDVERLEPEFAYLIRRIIDRIPDSQSAVRWVVRYGVVPQRLTREFLQNVMEPHLRRELEGGDTQRLDELKEYGASFPRGAAIDVEELWTALRSYADPTGWLRVDAEELRFQPEVVRPMRALLEKETIYRELHIEAARWFADQAEREVENPVRWALLQGEVFYHRLQLKDSGLESLWEDLLKDNRAEEADVRRELLKAVTTLLPAKEDVPKEADGRPLLSSEFLGRTHLDLAKLEAGIWWGPCRVLGDASTIRNLLADARAYLGEVESFEQGSLLVEMALAVNERDYDKAGDLAVDLYSLGALSIWPGDENLFALYLLIARTFVGQKDASAASQYQSAANLLSARNEQDDYTQWDVLAECIRELGRMGHVTGALLTAKMYYPPFNKQVIRREPFDRFQVELAELFLQARDYSRAESAALSAFLVETMAVHASPEWFRARRVIALCKIARGRLQEAEQQRIDDLSGLAPDPVRLFQRRELDGIFAAADYDLVNAPTMLQDAVQGYSRMGEREAAAQALLRAVRVLKELKGDWAEARKLIERSDITSDLLTIERAHLLYLAGEEDFGLPDGTAEWVRAAVELMTGGEHRSGPNLLSKILKHLEDIYPTSLRYEHVHFMRWVPRLEGVSYYKNEFRRLLPEPESSERDFFPLVLDLIEVLRCIEADSAQYLLRKAFREAGDAEVFLYERLLDAAGRLGGELPYIDGVLNSARRLRRYGVDWATMVRLQSLLIERGDPRASEVTIELDSSMPNILAGTQFEVMHLINQANLLNQRQAPSRKGEEPKELARRAAELLRMLGREAEARRVLARAEAGTLESLKESKKRIEITLRAVPAPFESRPSSEVVSFDESLFLVREPQRVIRSMRDALPVQAEEKPVVELAVDDADSVSLPWEWAFSERQLCFRSAKAMPNPKTPPLTRLIWPRLPAALRRLIGKLWRIRILILRPPVAYQEKTQRGADLATRRPLAEIYSRHGAEVLDLSRLTDERVSQIFRWNAPHLIHIQASVVERRGQLGIDLPIKGASDDTTLLGVDFWDQQFRMIRSVNKPVVLLDPPRPNSDVEVARQLLLRNRFAADLAAKGIARAILCAGLFDPAATESAAERLALEISGDPQFRQLLTLLQTGLAGDRFCTKGAALFVADPETLLW